MVKQSPRLWLGNAQRATRNYQRCSSYCHSYTVNHVNIVWSVIPSTSGALHKYWTRRWLTLSPAFAQYLAFHRLELHRVLASSYPNHVVSRRDAICHQRSRRPTGRVRARRRLFLVRTRECRLRRKGSYATTIRPWMKQKR